MKQLSKAAELLQHEQFHHAYELLRALDASPSMLWMQGIALHGMNRHAEALAVLRRGRFGMRGQLDGLRCAVDIAITYNKMGRVREARRILTTCKQAFESRASGDDALKCDLYLAITTARQGNFQTFLQIHTGVAKALLRQGLFDLYVVGQTVACACLVNLGRYEEAEQVIVSGLALAEERELTYRIAQFEYYRAWIAYERGEPSLSEADADRIEDRCHRSGSLLLRTDFLTLRMRLAYARGELVLAQHYARNAYEAYLGCDYLDGAATCQISSGLLALAQGSYSVALAAFAHAESLADTTRNDTLKAMAHIYLGWVHVAVSSLDVAQVYLTNAIKAFERLDLPHFAAQACVLMAHACIADDTLWLEKAHRHALNCEQSVYRGETARWLAEHCLVRGQVSEAWQYATSARHIFTELGYVLDVLQSQILEAECALALGGNADESDPGLDKAVQGLPNLAVRLALIRAEYAQRQGDRISARQHLQEAGRQAHIIRLAVSDPILAGHLASTFERIYMTGCRLGIALNDPEMALLFSEERRSQWLKRRLQLAHSDIVGPDAEASALSEHLRLIQISMSQQWSWANLGRAPDVDVLRMQLTDLGAKYLRLEARRAAQGSNGVPLPVRNEYQPSVTETQTVLGARYGLDWTAIILEPLDNESREWLLMRIAPNGYSMQTLLTTPVLRLQLGLLCDTDAHARRMAYGDAQVMHSALNDISNWLHCSDWIPKNSPNTHTIVLADSGRISRLAFCALPLDGRHLIERASLIHSPSLWIALHKFERQGKTPHQQTNKVLLVAPVIFNGRHADLPYSMQEIEDCRTLWPEAHILIGEAATTKAIRELQRSGELARFDAIVFATHACHMPGYPRLSALAMFDGELSADEISNWTLGADLVCISACEGGRFSSRAGEERVGLEASFLAAGVRSVLSAQWAVSDTKAASFVADVIQRYHLDQNIGWALAVAQRQRLTENIAFDWAAWRVSGAA